MEKLIRVGMDTSKSVFQLHGVNAAEEPVLRRKLRRDELVKFFSKLPPTLVGIEACGASHHWARVLRELGHDVRLMPAQYVKAYVQRSKNDAADAAAICEALSRPMMRFVPVKTAEQQASLMLESARALLVKQQTQIGNAIRGHAAEFGVTGAKGLGKVKRVIERSILDPAMPVAAKEMFELLGGQLETVGQEIKAINIKLSAWHRQNDVSQRLITIPGIGVQTAVMLAMKVPDPHVFKCGRDFAAWLGLTPKDHSTGGRSQPGRITRAGDPVLRSRLVVGATSVISHIHRSKRRPSAWLLALVERKPPKLAAVALANKMARIAWKLMVSGETYQTDRIAPPMAMAA